MPGRIEGTVAVVSGAGSSGPGIGVGKATAILFAQEGARGSRRQVRGPSKGNPHAGQR